MRKLILLLTAFFVLALVPMANAEIVFQENFDGTGPGFSAWTLSDGGDSGGHLGRTG